MQKVVILSTFATPFRSGAEACAEEVATHLSDGYEAIIITARLRSSLARYSSLRPSLSVPPQQGYGRQAFLDEEKKVRVVRVGFGLPIDKWLFPFLAPFAARRFKPDILHAVLESYAGMALVLSRWIVPRAKRILTLQSTNTSFFLRAMHRSAHVITAISSVLVERAAHLGRTDVVLIPNGIPLAAIEKAAESRVKVPGRILFVGRLEAVKGVDVLLHAMAALKDHPSAHLRVVGNGSQNSVLQSLAWELGLSERVTFTGRLTDELLYAEYASAEIFCGLSRSEALGNVFLEAQAAGCAVVATNVGGIPDIVKDGETGTLVPPDDADAAATALQRMLDDEVLRHRLAEHGRRHAAAFDWSVIAERYRGVYKNVFS